MSMPRNETGSEMEMAWGVFAQSLEKSIRLLDTDIKEAKYMASKCTDEWCSATEHVIDELNNALFSIRNRAGRMRRFRIRSRNSNTELTISTPTTTKYTGVCTDRLRVRIRRGVEGD
jgi:hypothetical protein